MAASGPGCTSSGRAIGAAVGLILQKIMGSMSQVPANPQVLYPNEYAWLIFVSALDVMLTWIILYTGGYETNVLADAVVGRFGLPGLVVFKFALVLLVIVICETVGRRKPITGRRLAVASIAITCLPVVVSFTLLHH